MVTQSPPKELETAQSEISGRQGDLINLYFLTNEMFFSIYNKTPVVPFKVYWESYRKRSQHMSEKASEYGPVC